MNNKRTLVIAVVAFLAVILSVAASLVLPRSAESAHPIPVTGLSNPGGSQPNQIVRQNQVAGTGSTNQWKSFREYLQAHQAPVVNPNGTRQLDLSLFPIQGLPGDQIPGYRSLWLEYLHKLGKY